MTGLFPGPAYDKAGNPILRADLIAAAQQAGRDCHVGCKRTRLAVKGNARGALCPYRDARLLSPDPEGPRASAPVVGGGHQMTTWMEVTINDAVSRHEPLRLSWRLEPLHLPLSPPRRPMRILGTIVQIPAPSMPDIGQDIAAGDVVALQTISDEAPWFVSQPS